MKIISLEDLTEDMVIARDIYGSSSQCLVSKGTSVTETLKKSLIRYNITMVPVEDVKKKKVFTEEEIVKTEEELKKQILERFRETPSEPLMKLLFKTILRMEAEEKLEKNG